MNRATGDERTWRVFVAPCGLAAAVVVLVVAGHGTLALPHGDDLGGWLEAVGPVTAAMAIVRVVALAVAVWLLAVTAFAAVARLAGAVRLEVLVLRAVPDRLRRGLAVLVGVGTAGAGVVGVGGPIATEVGASPPATATMAVIGDEGAGPPTAEAAATMAVVAATEAPADWVVAPGESFWSIAEDTLGDELGRTPTDAEVVPYWERLIAANRDRLVTGDPDLLYPGQTLTLP